MYADKRIWNPDNSCTPFLLSNAWLANALTFVPISFTVPENRIAVLHLLNDVDVYEWKSRDIAAIKYGKPSDTGIVTGLDRYGRIVSSNGGLMNVRTVSEGSNIPGYVHMVGARIPWERSIVLSPGDYHLWDENFSATYKKVVISGYTFPVEPSTMVDDRLWNPDDTCLPFLLNNCSNVQNLEISFTIPSGSVAVFTSIGTNTNTATNVAKDSFNWNFFKDGGTIPWPIRGALTNVREMDITGARDVPGFITLLSMNPFPVRIELPSGDWVWRLTAALGDNASTYLQGYTYREKR